MGFLFVKMKILDSQQMYLKVDTRESVLLSSGMYALQKYFASQEYMRDHFQNKFLSRDIKRKSTKD